MKVVVLGFGLSTLAASMVTLLFYLAGIWQGRVAGRQPVHLAWHVVAMAASLAILVLVVLSVLPLLPPDRVRWLALGLILQNVSLLMMLASHHRRFIRLARRCPSRSASPTERGAG